MNGLTMASSPSSVNCFTLRSTKSSFVLLHDSDSLREQLEHYTSTLILVVIPAMGTFNMTTQQFYVFLLVLLICSELLVLSNCKRNRRKKNSENSQNKTKGKTRIYHPSKSKWPSPRININWKSFYVLTKKPTHRVLCKIFCRSGYHVQILSTGIVRGTVNQRSKYILFEMQSFGPSLVKIKSVATGRYLSMKRDGTLRATRHGNSKETIFKETHEMNAFHSYASHKYFRGQPHDLLVGIKRNGEVKRATRTLHGQTATQFLVIKK